MRNRCQLPTDWTMDDRTAGRHAGKHIASDTDSSMADANVRLKQLVFGLELYEHNATKMFSRVYCNRPIAIVHVGYIEQRSKLATSRHRLPYVVDRDTLVPDGRDLLSVVAEVVRLGDTLLVCFSSGLSPVASSPPSDCLKHKIFF